MYDLDELYIDSDLFSQFAGIDENEKERIIDAMNAAGLEFDDFNIRVHRSKTFGPAEMGRQT